MEIYISFFLRTVFIEQTRQWKKAEENFTLFVANGFNLTLIEA